MIIYKHSESCIKKMARRIGGLYGAVLMATVNAFFVSHFELKGHRYTFYMSDGTFMMESKKQTPTPTSSTDLELLFLGAQLLFHDRA